jgi:hypothetical protein
MNGELVEGVVPDLLREIYVGGRSGILTLSRGDERQSLRFRRGHLVNAQTNVVEERLGEMLVRRGLLSLADLARATEIVLREKRRLGEVLSELGLIDADGLENAVAARVYETLARVFSWPDGTFVFEEEPEEEGGRELTLKVSTGDLILEAVRAVRDPDVVRYALGEMDRVLVLSSDPLLRFQNLTLSPADGFVLSRVDGVASARQIVQMITQPSDETQRSLFALLSTGVIEYAEGVRAPREAAAPVSPPPEPVSPPPEPVSPPPVDEKVAGRRREILDAWEGLKSRTHFEVLGLARSVGEGEVKDAYFRLAKRFHPDAHHGAELGDLRDKLEAIFIRLSEAYDVLRDPAKRGDYEARLGRDRPRPEDAEAARPSEPAPHERPRDPEEESRLAEGAVRAAVSLVEQEKYWDAIQKLEPVVEVVQGKTLMRARVLLARCYIKNPRWAKSAEAMLLAATRQDPKAVEPWALLATIYAEKGLRSRAIATYRKLLELSPDHEEAARYLAQNAPAAGGETRAEGRGGLLGRLFRS